MRFLLLNQTFVPDVASSGQHLADLASGLAERGHRVTVVAGRRAYDNPKTIFASRETWRGVQVRRVGSTGLGKSARWRRVVDSASFFAGSALRVPWFTRQDAVVALTSPPLIALAGLALATLQRSRFIYWVMDLNPDEAIAVGWLVRDSIISRALEWLSRLSLRHAHQLVVLDRTMRERLLTKGVPAERITVLAPWSHDSEAYFDAAGRDQFRREYGLEGKFVVMYSGNHSPCHPLDTLLAAAARLAADPRFTFCFIGGGTEFRKIQHRIASKDGLVNVLCLPYQPLNRISVSLSAADAHVVVMGEKLVGLVHPCKVYNLLRIGQPIFYIGPASPVSEIIGEAPRSGCLAHGDVEGLVGRLLETLDDAFRKPAPAALPWADRFSKRTLLPRFVEMLEREGRQSFLQRFAPTPPAAERLITPASPITRTIDDSESL